MDSQMIANCVAAFAQQAGMPFFQLDNNNSAAALLGDGIRFELEYLEKDQRIFMFGDVAPATESELGRTLERNVGLMARTGLALGLCSLQGQSHLILMASLPVRDLTPEKLGETATILIETIRALRGGNALTSPSPAASDSGLWMTV